MWLPVPAHHTRLRVGLGWQAWVAAGHAGGVGVVTDIENAWEAWLDAPSGDDETNRQLADAIAATDENPVLTALRLIAKVRREEGL
jgi:hypothetical protein